MPVTVVPTSFATVAIETFITELSSVIRNWPAARVRRTSVAPAARADDAGSALSIRRVSTRRPGRGPGSPLPEPGPPEHEAQGSPDRRERGRDGERRAEDGERDGEGDGKGEREDRPRARQDEECGQPNAAAGRRSRTFDAVVPRRLQVAQGRAEIRARARREGELGSRAEVLERESPLDEVTPQGGDGAFALEIADQSHGAILASNQWNSVGGLGRTHPLPHEVGPLRRV